MQIHTHIETPFANFVVAFYSDIVYPIYRHGADKSKEIKMTGKQVINAVFEGGGVKGVGLVGAVSVTEENGYRFGNVAGTSAGAIIATLMISAAEP